jgi:hypothetical protein
VRLTIALLALSLVSATSYAADKQYESGVMMSIRPSHSQTFYQGTSIDLYYEGYSVRIGDTIYSGWCRDRLLSGCDTNFVIHAPVQVRLDKSHFYLLRSNGKEQKVTIGQRELVPVPAEK